jgi:hypothetical protein
MRRVKTGKRRSPTISFFHSNAKLWVFQFAAFVRCKKLLSAMGPGAEWFLAWLVRRHPQLLMVPLRRVAHATTDSAPQSHRQFHSPPNLFLPTRFRAVSLPKRWPVMSIKRKQPQLLVSPVLRQSPPTSNSRPQSQTHNQRILPSFLRSQGLRATSRPNLWSARSIIANFPPALRRYLIPKVCVNYGFWRR